MIVDGWPINSFMEKLKGLKTFLKGWNKEKFGNIFSQKQALIDRLTLLTRLKSLARSMRIMLWKRRL